MRRVQNSTCEAGAAAACKALLACCWMPSVLQDASCCGIPAVATDKVDVRACQKRVSPGYFDAPISLGDYSRATLNPNLLSLY